MRRYRFGGLDIAMRVAMSVILWLSILQPEQSRAEKTTVVVSFTQIHGYLLIIPVMIDGTGPYDFVIDTGASITILDERLFRDLHLGPTGLRPLSGIVSEGRRPTTVLHELSVAGLSIEGLSVVGVRNLSTAFPSAARRIDGVLGDDFLCQYDLLIDNRNHTITFDTGRELITELGGVRIPMNNQSQVGFEVYRHRPMIGLNVPSYSQKSIEVLVDSGAQTVVLLPRDTGRMTSRLGEGAIATSITVLGGTIRCASWNGNLRSGNLPFGEHILTVCPRLAGQPLDNEGSLPTALFRSIFIAHREAFVIFNPARLTVRSVVYPGDMAVESVEK